MSDGDEQPTDTNPIGSTYAQGDDGQDYVDRSKIDFDPEDGLYTGTLVTGDSQIPTADEADADAQPDGADAEQPAEERQS